MKIYVVLEDMDANLGSSCDTVTGAYRSREAAENAISKLPYKPYAVVIVTTELADDAPDKPDQP